MSSPEDYSPSPLRTSLSRTASIGGDKSRSRSMLTKDMSIDEGDALKKISEEADEKLRNEKKKSDEAKKYWHQKRHQEQAKFSDEEIETTPTRIKQDEVTATSTPLQSVGTSTPPGIGRIIDNEFSPTLSRKSSRPSSSLGVHENVLHNGEVSRNFQEKYAELETQYKEAMVSQAKLYDEKIALVYQIESLKDEIEDSYQLLDETKAELHKHQSKILHAKHTEESLHSDIDKLKNHIQYRDDFMKTHGLHLPTITEEDEDDLPSTQLQFIPLSERDELLKQISNLKEEVEEAKNAVPLPPPDSLLRGEETKDIVRESTRLVSEYKNRLQLAEAETTRLEGTIERLKGQVVRCKSQLEDMEKREDELLKEKRTQSREVRRLQSLVDDFESENELLKRRVEQMRKRQKD